MLSSTSQTIPSSKKQVESLPTPSSSYCRSVISKDRDRSFTSNAASLSSTSKPTILKQYGSFIGMPLSDDTLSFDSAPPTPPHTTISPNDDDEGLYLLWTHQLLRDQGFRPATCRTNSFDNNTDEDEDDESSLSESITSITDSKQARLSPILATPSPRPILSSFTSFISSCLCPSS